MRFFVILCFFIVSCSHNIKESRINPKYQVEIVEAIGSSAIVNNDVDLAKKSALNDALKNALHLVVGVYISANSLVSKSVLIDDEITADTQGYVEKFEILKEYQENGMYYVKIKAFVRKEDLAMKAKRVENEVEKIGSPVVFVSFKDKTVLDFNGAENELIRYLKTDLFRVSLSTDEADLVINGNVITSFNTSEGLGGFISYRCSAEGKIFTKDGELVGGFAENSAGIGLSDNDARNNASVACARKIYPSVKNMILSFYTNKRTVSVEIDDVKTINEVNEIIKFFKNIPNVRNVYVRSFENNRCIFDVILHRGDSQSIYPLMSKNSMFDVEKINRFSIYAKKR